MTAAQVFQKPKNKKTKKEIRRKSLKNKKLTSKWEANIDSDALKGFANSSSSNLFCDILVSESIAADFVFENKNDINNRRFKGAFNGNTKILFENRREFTDMQKKFN